MELKLEYLDHIDFLRAIAVALVILFHLDIAVFKGGFLGVDVFFVISGFLITRNLNHEFKNTGKVDFRKFYIRRIRRLIPSLLLTVFLSFILSFLFFPPSLFTGFIKSMFFSSIALSNFHFLSETSYFDVSANLKPLLHTWSLGIEEQFYLLYPISLFLLLKVFSKNTYRLVIISSLIVLGLLLNFIVSKGHISEAFISYFISEDNLAESTSSIQFFLLPFRIYEFLLGAILIFIPKNKTIKQSVASTLNIIGLVLIIFSSVFFDSQTQYMSTLNLIPCFGAVLFIRYFPGKSIFSFYNASAFKTTGRISYTLYLFHWPIIVFYKYLYGNETNIIENISLVFLTFIISLVVYQYYEDPLRNNNLKTRIISNHGMISFILFSIIIISNIKLDVLNNKGWLWRVDVKTLESIKEFENPVEYNKKNWGAVGYNDFGFIGKNGKNTTPDMIWIGDSHAGHYSYGLDSILVKKNNKSVFMSYAISTLHLPDIIHKTIDSTVTKNHLNELLQLINSNPKIPLVISHFWIGEMSMTKIKNPDTGLFENFKMDSLGYNQLCQKIVKLTKLVGDRDVIIIGENPFKGKNDLSYVDNLLVPKYFRKVRSSSVFKPSDHLFQINSYFTKYFEKYKNIHFINPSDIFCADKKCLEQEMGKIYFSDKDHLSKTGSLKVIEVIEQELLNKMVLIDKTVKHSIDILDYIGPSEIIDHKSSKLIFKNWYNPEREHRWSSGNTSEIELKLNNPKQFKGLIKLNVGIWDQQIIKMFINDFLIESKKLSGWQNTLIYSFDPKILKEKNTIRFEFSHAKSPGERDKRVLALAFRTIQIE